jgi:hypothetical protein
MAQKKVKVTYSNSGLSVSNMHFKAKINKKSGAADDTITWYSKDCTLKVDFGTGTAPYGWASKTFGSTTNPDVNDAGAPRNVGLHKYTLTIKKAGMLDVVIDPEVDIDSGSDPGGRGKKRAARRKSSRRNVRKKR